MNSDNQNTFLSFLIGAAAGVAAGMLLAPYSGTESRRRIAKSANDIAGKVGSQWNNTSEKLSGYVDSAVSAVTNATGKGDQTTSNTTDRTASTGNRTTAGSATTSQY